MTRLASAVKTPGQRYTLPFARRPPMQRSARRYWPLRLTCFRFWREKEVKQSKRFRASFANIFPCCALRTRPELQFLRSMCSRYWPTSVFALCGCSFSCLCRRRRARFLSLIVSCVGFVREERSVTGRSEWCGGGDESEVELLQCSSLSKLPPPFRQTHSVRPPSSSSVGRIQQSFGC
jgi:hypothetical protein